MAPKSFAEVLREARTEAGLSQAALAKKAGLTGSYISLLESRRRPPPSPRVIRDLARALGLPVARLEEPAAIERTPAPLRRRLARMRRERGRAQRSRDRLLTTTLFHVARRPDGLDPLAGFLDLEPGQRAVLGRLLGRVRSVGSSDEAVSQADDLLGDTSLSDREALVEALPRVLERAAMGRPPLAAEPLSAAPPVAHELHVFADLGRRAAEAEPFFVPAALWSPRRFLWRVATDEAYPRVEPGDLLLVDPEQAPRENDLVAWRDGPRDRVGLYHLRQDEVLLASPRPEVPPARVPAATFEPAGTVVWLFRAL